MASIPSGQQFEISYGDQFFDSGNALCPPHALQSGEQVIRLEPGASATATWGVSLNG